MYTIEASHIQVTATSTEVNLQPMETGCIPFIPVKKSFETGSKSCPSSENQRPIALIF
jgi:hypothetical protein